VGFLASGAGDGRVVYTPSWGWGRTGFGGGMQKTVAAEEDGIGRQPSRCHVISFAISASGRAVMRVRAESALCNQPT